MASDRHKEIQVGIFIAVGLALTLLAIWMMGSTQRIFARHDAFFVTLSSAAGLSPGAKVTVSGVNAGMVESFSLNRSDQNVRVNLRIANEFEDSIKKDSFAEIATEGVLGDKLIAITAGAPSSPRLVPGSEIPARPELSLQTLLGRTDRLAASLTKAVNDLDQVALQITGQLKSDHLASSMEKVDRILGKIDEGNGTLAGLVNDPKLYDDAKALIGESNDNRIVRNIVRNAVKGEEKKED